MATCLGNYAELLAPIGFSEGEITARVSDQSKSDPPLFDLQPREFLLRLFLRREKIPPALAVDSRSFNDILRGCYKRYSTMRKVRMAKIRTVPESIPAPDSSEDRCRTDRNSVDCRRDC